MIPTPEQVAIIDAARSTKDNLLVNALAGAAKTTTLRLICEAVTGIPILSLAFNKKIAEEMTAKLPSHVTCKTLNALGHQVWTKSLGRKATLDFNKTHSIVKTLIESLPRTEQASAYATMGETIRAVGMAKAAGYVPASWKQIESLIPAGEFYASLDSSDNFEETVDQGLVDAALSTSIKQAYNGNIDFADQLYMPTLFGGTFPSFPLVLVDEAQDLSPLNHAMLRKLARTRIIAVGDPNQSIYGFRGAVTNGMSVLRSTFNMTEFTLSVSFRCPEVIVENVRWRAPHMQAFGPGGTIHHWSSWDASQLPDNAAIICRNNAPIFGLALELIKAGRSVRLLGADIGPALVKILRKLGPETMGQESVLTAIERWKSEKLAKAKSPGSIEDRAECLRVFALTSPDLKGAIIYAEHLFKQEGTIQLMSGHKSKGLEFDFVVHLDPWRVPSKWALSEEAKEQERNVKYVIDTRAKQTLVYADREAFHGNN